MNIKVRGPLRDGERDHSRQGAGAGADGGPGGGGAPHRGGLHHEDHRVPVGAVPWDMRTAGAASQHHSTQHTAHYNKRRNI